MSLSSAAMRRAFRCLQACHGTVPNSDPSEATFEPTSPLCVQLYELHWKFELFVQQELPPGRHLGQLVTVTGDDVDAFGASAAQYLSWRWPSTGLRTLRIIEDALVRAGFFSTGKSSLIVFRARG